MPAACNTCHRFVLEATLLSAVPLSEGGAPSTADMTASRPSQMFSVSIPALDDRVSFGMNPPEARSAARTLWLKLGSGGFQGFSGPAAQEALELSRVGRGATAFHVKGITMC